MKQIVSNYTYSPTANCVTLTGVNIDADQLLLIVAPEAGRTLYNFASVTGSVVPGASTRVNLTASTAGLTASSPLVIYYDDQASATSVTGTVALDPASLIALENVTVTIGSSVTVGGTVTANVFGTDGAFLYQLPVVEHNSGYVAQKGVAIAWNDAQGSPDPRVVSDMFPLPIQAPQGIGISGTVTANTRNYGLAGDPWIYVQGITLNHPTKGQQTWAGYYRWDGQNKWGYPYGGSTDINSFGYIEKRYQSDQAFFYLVFNDDGDDTVTDYAYSGSYGDFPLSGWQPENGVSIVSGSFIFTTEQRETYATRITNSVTIGSLPAISGTVTANVTNSVTIGSLPVQLSTTTIGGTARLNVTLSSATTVGGTAPSYANLYGGSDGTNLRAILTDTAGRSVVTVSNFPASQTVAGTVTANISGTVPVSGTFWQATQPVSLASLPSLAAGTAQIGSVTASISGTVPVSGAFWQATQPVSLTSTTVTVSALPSGALTTRFGSVTTANTAQITAAVTNTSRKYLLAQNISAGTVTIGIGFSPTTTQGIQLTAGAGLSFDAFCPTGAVYWLGATTGANFTILEG